MSCPPVIQSLLSRFTSNQESYSASTYNETQLRQEFLNPFFEALGWDVPNKQGFAEAYKEVIHEDAVKVGTATKAPDYSFRVGGTRKFFVEAKRPSVNIKDNIDPAFQLRRYAWSAKLPLSILTDFEEFAVYDCREKPNKNDKASVGRILYIRFEEYEKRWDEIASIFSKDAIQKGSFDKYAESARGKKGTSEVDDEFLEEISRWRELLARNIAINNPKLSQRELNFAVQRTIDRIVFLRICEARGIEHYGTLLELLNGENVYKRIRQNFQKADEIYNSGLFHFKDEKGRAEPPDTLTLSLHIDDKPLKDIIENLYYPESPYEFSVLPADILGQVYEQFLGKVIRLTAGHQAKVEDKPEVKKAGGVFYTPTYIVDYIVKNTVGKIVEGKTPKQIEKLKILDPACGSGSFLIQAYQFLADYHRDWYIKDGIEKNSKGKEPKLVQIRSGEWRLSTTERKKILLNNIHGVDIDSQAVEVTKLSLLLKVLEGENEQSLAQQMTMWHERALPDLENNIKCGNSLIGRDFYEGAQETMALDDTEDEERIKINAFDWDGKHGFQEIMSNGGFDVVIGNPPYGASFSDDELSYLINKFPIADKFPDSYCIFILEGLNLLKTNSIMSYIVPNTFCDLESCDEYRKSLLSNVTFVDLFQSGWAFKTAVVDTLVFILVKTPSKPNNKIKITVGQSSYLRTVNSFLKNDMIKIDYRNMETEKDFLLRVSKNTIPLGTLATVSAGVKMYEKGKGTPPQTEKTMTDRPFSRKDKCPKGWRALYRGEDVGRYELQHEGEYVNYGQWLAAPRSEELFNAPKILMRRTDYRLFSVTDNTSSICVNSCHVIKLKDNKSSLQSYQFLLGILNSKLLQRIFEIQNPQMVDKIFSEIKVIYVERLPIRPIDVSKASDQYLFNKIVSLVTSMLDFYKKFPHVKTDHEKTLLQRQMDAADQKIDELVYELYGLTKEEIRVVAETRETEWP
ncbi:MAG TPA: TaqI-like C-terminal specificity domain-containing protein [Chitinivibrionales bacterium]|nr:TaqI-like C-terminal specificity domain-containing protein [Chitinivibrionales bacterium]